MGVGVEGLGVPDPGHKQKWAISSTIIAKKSVLKTPLRSSFQEDVYSSIKAFNWDLKNEFNKALRKKLVNEAQ